MHASRHLRLMPDANPFAPPQSDTKRIALSYVSRASARVGR
jgi:hypothetical protein